MIPNIPPDDQVGVIPGSGLRRWRSRSAAPLLRCCSSALPRIPRRLRASGLSVQALLDQRACLDTLALIRGQVAVTKAEANRNITGKTVASRWNLPPVVEPFKLISCFCVDGTVTLRHDLTGTYVTQDRRGHPGYRAVQLRLTCH